MSCYINSFKNRSYAIVNSGVLKRNLEKYQSLITFQSVIMAVVKADAYGHGEQIIAKYLSDNGIHHFAVSNIDEAIHIRKAGTIGQILVLGYTPIERADELVQHNITQTLLSEDYADRLIATSLPVKCQFALDTGMRRIGLNADNPDECERVIRKAYHSHLQLDGLFLICV